MGAFLVARPFGVLQPARGTGSSTGDTDQIGCAVVGRHGCRSRWGCQANDEFEGVGRSELETAGEEEQR